MVDKGLIEDAARAFLAAVPGDCRALVTGKLLEIESLAQRKDDKSTLESVTEQRLEIERIDQRLAVVAVDAIVSYVNHFGASDYPVSMNVSGPMRLLREGETWKVADYSIEGTSFCDSVTLHDAAPRDSHGITLIPLFSYLGRRHVACAFTARNNRGETVWAKEGFLVSWNWIQRGFFYRDVEIGAGEEAKLALQVQRSSRRPPRKLSLVLPLFAMESRRWLHPRYQVPLR